MAKSITQITKNDKQISASIKRFSYSNVIMSYVDRTTKCPKMI